MIVVVGDPTQLIALIAGEIDAEVNLLGDEVLTLLIGIFELEEAELVFTLDFDTIGIVIVMIRVEDDSMLGKSRLLVLDLETIGSVIVTMRIEDVLMVGRVRLLTS